MVKQSFAEKLHSLMLPKETQQQFAERTGLNRNTIGQYLANKNEKPVSTDTVIQIAKKCNVSSDWLLGLTDVKKPNIKLRAVSEYLGLSADAVDNMTFLNKKSLDAILSDKKTVKLFSRMLDNIALASSPRSPIYDDNGVMKGLLQDQRDFYCVLAGRCVERIAEYLSKTGDE